MRKRLLILGLIVSALACAGGDDPREQPIEMTTLEDVPTELKPIVKPPQIEFEQSAPPADVIEGEFPGDQPAIPEESESTMWLENLPFAPKIAMDPVDGSKISIRLNTPIAEFKGRIYYFSSEANRMEFIRNPEEYLSGAFASY